MSLDGYFHLWKAENNLCKVTPDNSAPSVPAVPLCSEVNPQFYCLFLPASVH